MGVQFPGKKRYVTLEWPLSGYYTTPGKLQTVQSRIGPFLLHVIVDDGVE